MLGASTSFVSAGREVPMDRRRVLLSIAGFGVAVVISTPGIAGDDLCKSPRLGVTPSWCDTKPTEKLIPEGHVRGRTQHARLHPRARSPGTLPGGGAILLRPVTPAEAACSTFGRARARKGDVR